MKTYLRDSEACIGFCRGFTKADVSLALMMMIDFMAMHDEEYGGIPCEPSGYLIGLLGVGQRKWTQTIEPALVKSGRIRKVTRNGIKVWVFPDDQMRGDKALFRPFDQRPQLAPDSIELKPTGWGEYSDGVRKGAMLRDGDFPAVQVPGQVIHVPDARRPPHAEMVSEALKKFEDGIAERKEEKLEPVPAPAVEDTTPAQSVPSHSAYEVLKQAGIDVDSHERGEFFWHRTEHNEVLMRWLEAMPLNEIIARIHRAGHEGKLPKSPNGLLAYENIVLGE